MRATWLERREESWPRRLALAPLAPAGWLYGAGAALDRRLHESGWLARRRLAARVVSVGNLVVGGAAKTPLAAWLAAGLHRRGRKVALLSRGYGRSGGGVEIVSDGRRVLATTERAGDEPMLLAALAPGVPVLVARDRGVAGLRAFSAFGADLLVLDDGFQHHRLHRDLDLVCFDGGLGFGNRRVLPRGPLREPVGALSRADGIPVVDGPLPAEDEALLAELAPDARRFAARRRPRGLRPLGGGGSALTPATDLAGAELGLLAGLARPDSVRRTLAGLGARVVAERLFPDHHRYRAADLAGLAREAPRWITTEKDAVKLAPGWAGDARLEVLAISIAVEEPEALLDWVERRLRQAPE